LLPNTPHGGRSTQTHVHVVLLPARCTHVPGGIKYTFGAKADGGEKKASQRKFLLLVPSASYWDQMKGCSLLQYDDPQTR
jgi:hypothetical protein